nr:vitamin K epoxide reductase family protein [Nannocystis sp. SCPEA4]
MLSVHPTVGGAAILCLLSGCGIAVSVLLTLLKFQSTHECDVAILSACQLGGAFACGQVLSSEWSTVFTDVPISIVATAYYAVVLGLAGGVMWRARRFQAVARPLLLWLAWAGLVVVVLLFLYATLEVGGLCSYCVIVYGITAAVFLITWWMHPEGHRAGLRALFTGVRRRASTAGFAALSFVALVLTQTLAYRQQAASSGPKPSCVASGELPGTTLQTGPTAPTGEIALFVDLACPSCAREFDGWLREVSERSVDYRVAIYHFPLEGECLPPGSTQVSPTAMEHESCRAARAVECIERQRPGAGLELVKRLFAAQQEIAGRLFTRENLVGFAREVGLPAADEAAFQHCFEYDQQIVAQIREHVRFAEEQKLTETPGAFLVFYDESGEPLQQLVMLKGAKDMPDRAAYLVKARARVQE